MAAVSKISRADASLPPRKEFHSAIGTFWYTTLDTLNAFDRTRPLGAALARIHTVVPTTWYSVIALLVLTAFWDYWRTLP